MLEEGPRDGLFRVIFSTREAVSAIKPGMPPATAPRPEKRRPADTRPEKRRPADETEIKAEEQTESEEATRVWSEVTEIEALNWGLAIQGRSVYLPSLDRRLSFVSVDGPKVASVQEIQPNTIDEFLCRVGGCVSSYPSRQALTLERWLAIADGVKNILSDDRISTLVEQGTIQTESCSLLLHTVDQLSSEFTDNPMWFCDCCLYSSIIGGGFPNRPFFSNPYPWRAISQWLRERLPLVDFATLNHWVRITEGFNSEALPEMREAYEQIRSAEIPFAGSNPIKALTLPKLRDMIRGCAIVPLGAAAYNAPAQLAGHHYLHAIAFLTEAFSLALLFIGFGSLVPLVERAIERVGQIALPDPKKHRQPGEKAPKPAKD
jgi:hypothetical protein